MSFLHHPHPVLSRAVLPNHLTLAPQYWVYTFHPTGTEPHIS